jgi:hypothetical protein
VVSQFWLNSVILNLPFLSQILLNPLENLPGDWEYVQLTGDLCFIKNVHFWLSYGSVTLGDGVTLAGG